MQNQFLMIQNPGICPPEGFTIFGVSTARSSANNDTIGKFGSGSKHAVNLCLRNDISPIIFCSLSRLQFYVKQAHMDDGISKTEFGQVHCKFSGKDKNGKSVNRDKDLSFALEYGTQDWTDLSMGLREFVSNAIDQTIRLEYGFQKAIEEDRLSVKIVDAPSVRAKDGYTRVFVPLTQEVQRFFGELPKRFLHFSEPEMVKTKILPKKDRNFGSNKSPMIYRRGVLVREAYGTLPSLFDYNFNDEELAIDESRNVDDWTVRSAIASSLRSSSVDVLSEIFIKLLEDSPCWEAELDSYYLDVERIYQTEEKNKSKRIWAEAWEKISDNAVMVGPESVHLETLKRKGQKVRIIQSSSWLDAAEKSGLKTASKVLSKLENDGIDIIETTPAAIEAVDIAWKWAVRANLTNGVSKPNVKSFRAIMSAESETFGLYQDDTVFINEAHSSNGVNKRVLQTALEEVVHHITKAGDNSRDFQSFALKMIVELMLKD